jgi:nucleoid-associated protein YgaU
VPQDVTTRRATSKTVVVRSTDEAPLAPETNADLVYSNSALGVPSGIQRRSSPPAPRANGRSSSIAEAGRSTARIADPASDTYRVAPDDNFWKISRKQYGTARYFQALMRHNQERVPDPQKLRPGTQVLTPPAAVLEQRYPELIEKSAPPTAPASGSDGAATRPRFEKPFSTADTNDRTGRPDAEGVASGYFYSKTGEPLYRIGADDTLTGIAQRHLGRSSRWNEIYDKNQDVLKSPDSLTLGTVIRLPSDASRLSLVPDAERRR